VSSDAPPVSAELLARALERLPVFPLPRAQLFPGVPLPLHVFEPRYRAMMRDVLSAPEAERFLAVAELEPGFESTYEGRPRVFPVCGVGRVVWRQALPDGRFNLVLRGEARVRIEREHPPERPYRQVRARLLADQNLPPATEGSALLAMARLFAPNLPEGGAALLQMLDGVTRDGVVTAAAVADVLAGTLIQEPALRRTLLEGLDVTARVAAVSAELVTLMRAVEPSGSPRSSN
jgi:Lon protease-like protein